MRVTELPPHLFADAVDLWHEAGLTRPWNDADEDLLRAIGGSASTVLACLDRERLLGTAMVGHDGHRGWLYYVAVRQTERGRGLGRLLVQTCEDWLAARGVPKVQLMIREGNTSAVAFYERLGYERSAVTVVGRRLDS
ncbi:MAG TPA: GNAT family acetyltransferase [Acidimicrobiales bacterium]|nr:GNAT family acetyltransferase [Acidimicrobiales bacterium]